MVVPAPHRNDGPSLLLGITAIAVPTIELGCHGRRIGLIPTDTEEDIETFCNPQGIAPGSTKWQLDFEVINSFGDEGLFNVLWPHAKQLRTMSYSPDGTTTASATNPIFSFNAYVPTPKPVDAGVEKFTIYSLPFKIYGPVTPDYGA